MITCSAPLASQEGNLSDRGFTLAALFPLTQGLAPWAAMPSVLLPSGELRISSTAWWSNTLRYDDGSQYPYCYLLADGEELVGRLALSLGLGQGFELESWVEGAAAGGGVMDAALSGFHKAFGFPNQARDMFPDNQLSFLIVGPRGIIMDVATPFSGLTSLGAGLLWRLPLDLPITAAIRATYPLQAPDPWVLVRSSAVEGALAWHGESGRFFWSLSSGVAWQDPSKAPAAFLAQDLIAQAGFRLFYEPIPSLAVGVEAAASSSPFTLKVEYLDGIAGNSWFGGKARLGQGLVLEAAIIEELASWASIEVGFQIGLSWEYGAGSH
ncbi:MAG: hypothetical protein WCQ50_12545 [Spirochaetota bacterium]